MNQYDDMLDLPHHVSQYRKHMSMIDRGAQFSPFAALTGYEQVLAESARLTEESVELTEGAMEVINRRLRELCLLIEKQPAFTAVCFRPDEKKDGGSYETVQGRLRKYDSLQKVLLLTDGRKIPLESLLSIEAEDMP